MRDLHSYFPILDEINRKAGDIIRRYYGTQLEIDLKADESPVTRADREVELLLRDALEKHFPDHSIFGEEFGETRKPGAHRWIIDPIDGTKSFILNTPLFGTLLALERDGVPVLGSIYLPIQDRLMIGSAETGTFIDGKPCSVSRTAQLKDARLLLTGPTTLFEPEVNHPLLSLCKAAGLVRCFGDCYGYFMVACGVADVMIDPSGIQYYDIAPMLPIFAGAGGRFTSTAGQTNFNAGSGLATNGLLHDEVLSVLNAC